MFHDCKKVYYELIVKEKIEENKTLMNDIALRISEMENKMRLESASYFVYLFEQNYPVSC